MDRCVKSDEQKATVTVYDVCKILGCGRNKAYDMVKSGKLASIRVGSRYLIPRVAVERLLNRE